MRELVKGGCFWFALLSLEWVSDNLGPRPNRSVARVAQKWDDKDETSFWTFGVRSEGVTVCAWACACACWANTSAALCAGSGAGGGRFKSNNTSDEGAGVAGVLAEMAVGVDSSGMGERLSRSIRLQRRDLLAQRTVLGLGRPKVTPDGV